MFAPLSWLKKYVDFDIPVEELADRLTMTGSEVEGYEYLGKSLDLVVVGSIQTMDKHPDADRLRVCAVDVGDKEPITIVTGANNINVGDQVPIALVGSHLPNGMDIKKSKLRGIASFGMMCSGDELQIDDSVYPGASVNGIMILHEEYAAGTPIAAVLGMDDTVMEVKTYANRPDCLSIIGTAREISATLNTPLQTPSLEYEENERASSDIVSVEVIDTDLCPRYIGKVVYDVNIEPSPKWMQKALIAAGVRPINNIVDITNYVMLEYGQPMHAFDFKYVKGDKIIVRRAQEGETITTLDDVERTLDPSMLVIADEASPVALAGIMGGEYSGVYDDTEMVLFESASFIGSNIRATSKKMGLRTESSARFEKQLDPATAETAMNRAMSLVAELNAGKIAYGCVDALSVDTTPRTISISVDRINAHLGQDIPANTMDGILRRLQIEAHVEDGNIICEIPTYRQDLETYADIAEEIMRIYGFDKIPSILPEMHIMSGGRTPRQKLVMMIRAMMASQGLYEAAHYSFMSPSALTDLGIDPDYKLNQAVRILNPLGEDYSLMRTTLIPAMIQSISNNVNHKVDDVKLFEISKTFHPTDDELPREVTRLSIGLCAKGEDFYTLKGRLEKVFDTMRFRRVEFKAGGQKFLHPGRKAKIVVDDEPIGYLGEMHPDVAEKKGIKTRVYLAELNLDRMMEIRSEELIVKELPKYPAIDRDLAVIVDETQPVGPLLADIRQSAGPLLETVEVFDIYQGEQVGEGKKSVAFSLLFRSMERTLTDKEVNSRFNKILRTLERNYGAQLR